jgi:thiamine pyrophosphate-dependent acetolactate synthase large subunit-like protein
MPQKCQPGRQVICLAGDGGFAMLLGELLTVVQEDLPIKIVVYDNGKLGFVDIEQKAAGLVPLYTDLKNPDFGAVAQAVGLWGRRVERAGELEDAIQAWRRLCYRALNSTKMAASWRAMWRASRRIWHQRSWPSPVPLCCTSR